MPTPAHLSYTVAVSFTDPKLADEWLVWLRGGHVAEVLAGGAVAAEIVEMDSPPAGVARHFEVRYRFPTRQAFLDYEQLHAPRLRAEGLAKFPLEMGVSYRRTLGVSIEQFGK